MNQEEGAGRIAGMKALRESRKETIDRVRDRVKEQNRVERLIAGAVKDGPKSVPEISGVTGLPPETVLWYLMALKKYGKVTEGQKQDSYFAYAMKEG
jgi:predicted transcriptional regulator